MKECDLMIPEKFMQIGAMIMQNPEMLQKLAAAAGNHIHPDSRALLKLLDDGPPHFLFVGGIDDQALLLRRHI